MTRKEKKTMFKMTLKAEDYNEILRLGKIVKPDRKNTHEELDNIAIYIDDPLVEGEALFCDNYLYGKFVFQIAAFSVLSAPSILKKPKYLPIDLSAPLSSKYLTSTNTFLWTSLAIASGFITVFPSNFLPISAMKSVTLFALLLESA